MKALNQTEVDKDSALLFLIHMALQNKKKKHLMQV